MTFLNRHMKKPIFAVVMALSVATLPHQPHAGGHETANRLLAVSLDSLGGKDAVERIRSISSISEVELLGTGLKGSIESYTLKPCLSRTTVTLGSLIIEQGYDGNRIWLIDQNGKLQYRRDTGSVRDQVSACLMENFGYLFPESGFTAEYAGLDTLDGTACHVIDILPDGGSPCKLLLDSSTFLMKSLFLDNSEGGVEQVYSDYRVIEGVKLPFHTISRQLATGMTFEIRTVSIEINQRQDPLVFFPPVTDKLDYEFVIGNSSEDIVFTYENGHIYLPVRIHGSLDELMFMVDSGAGMTVIDSSLAVGYGLTLEGPVRGIGAFGQADFFITRIEGLSIEGIEFQGQNVISYPLSGIIERSGGLPVGGILGYDFLSRFISLIEFESGTISFFQPDSFESPDYFVPVEAPLIHNVFALTGTLDGKYVGTFLLDTGANSSMLSSGFIRENGLGGDEGSNGIMVLGAGGAQQTEAASFESFVIGPFTIRDPSFLLSTVESGLGSFKSVSGIIGNDILERFTVILDYVNQSVYLDGNTFSADEKEEMH